jgi:hypothetical protein
MAIENTFNMFQFLPDDMLEEIVGNLPFHGILNLAQTNKDLQKRLEALKPLAERRSITKQANLLKYGQLLFSQEELKRIAASPNEEGELTRSFKTSQRASRLITNKISSREPFFGHQSQEQLNQLALAIIRYDDEQTLRKFMENPRFMELSDDSIKALVRHLALNNSTFVAELINHPRFQRLSQAAFYNVIFDVALRHENSNLLTILINSVNFNNLNLDDYIRLLSFSCLSPSPNSLILANHRKFRELNDEQFQNFCEMALRSSHTALIDFIISPSVLERVNNNTLSRAWQACCFSNQITSVQTLLRLPGLSQISNFSLCHGFISLCEKRSLALSEFIQSALFESLSAGNILEGIEILVQKNDFQALDLIFSSARFNQLFDERAFDLHALNNIVSEIKRRNHAPTLEVFKKHFDWD